MRETRQMDRLERDILKQELDNCKNVQEMFDLLSNRFDLENANPNAFIRGEFIKGIVKGIDYLKPKVKNIVRDE